MLIAMLCLFASVARAGELRLLTESDAVVEGRAIEVQILARDLELATEPELVAGEGLGLSYRGRSGSSRSYGGRNRSEWIFSYSLSGLTPGTWQLGPVEISVDGRPYQAESLSIEVLPRPLSDLDYARVQSHIEDTQPFLGEVLMYQLDILTRNGARGMKLLSRDFGGLVEEPGIDVSQEAIQSNVEGKVFQGTRLLFPLRAVAKGTQRILPTQMQILLPVEPSRDRQSRGAAEAVLWASEAIDVQVRTLPTLNRPDEFSGLVGQFQLQVGATKRSIELGESLSIEVEILGNGTLDGFSLPPPPEGSSFRVYDEPTETQALLHEGAYQAYATIQRAVVPEVEGALVIPPIEISIFNPDTERYEWLRSSSIEIEVLPGQGSGPVTSYGGTPRSVEEVEDLGEDILPATLNGQLHAHDLESALPWAMLLSSLPLLGLVGLSLGSRIQAHRDRPHTRRLARLERLPADPDARLQSLAGLVHERMGEALGVEPGAIDASTVAQLGPEAEALYQDLIRSRYGDQPAEDLELRAKAFVRGRRP
jgi:hypothetical protein